MQKFKAYRNADQQTRESTLTVEGHWLRIEDQMSFLQQIWHTFNEQLKVHYLKVFQVLQGKLQKSIDLIAHVVGLSEDDASMPNLLYKRGRLRRGKFAWSAKECIDRAIRELDEWHSTFDPSWYMIRCISNNLIDDQLAKLQTPVTSPVSVLKSMRDDKHNGIHSAGLDIFISSDFLGKKSRIPHSAAQTAFESANGAAIIVDTMTCHADICTSTVIKDVRDLARKLTKTDPLSFNLLGCRGVVKTSPTPDTDGSDANLQALTFDFIFAIPQNFSNPRSLRNLLLCDCRQATLDKKVELARQLANSVAFVHSANFVHKNIRPENILVFEEEASSLGAAFLVGFEGFRMADGRTYGHSEALWEKTLYRHPRQQGLLPNEYYLMQHDIYTLGVCLLEIGLWQSCVITNQDMEDAQPGCGLDLSGTHNINDRLKRAFLVKDALVTAAQERLPITVGSRYAGVVVSCLTCLDEDNQGLGDESEFRDSDGVVIGVRYIEKILLELQQIAV